jgi:hypothetical protein
MESRKFFRWDWWKDFGTPLAIVIVGWMGSQIISDAQIESAEKTAQSEQQIKMWEIFSKDLLDPNYDKDVVEDDPIIKLFGSILAYSDSSSQNYRIARAMFEESVNTAINHFYRDEPIRIRAARSVAVLYYIDKKFIVKRLIDEIKPEEYIFSAEVNGTIVIAFKKVPGYWEGTKEQYEKVRMLKTFKYLGEKENTNAYKSDLQDVLNSYKEFNN